MPRQTALRPCRQTTSVARRPTCHPTEPPGPENRTTAGSENKSTDPSSSMFWPIHWEEARAKATLATYVLQFTAYLHAYFIVHTWRHIPAGRTFAKSFTELFWG